ncbi:hypothetical protein [Maritimibacter sp. 55A14]|uniref:hypothetical protein n=1 Tax=Maritimibacter sp. 55A14 TaxID=2174844 RepID=UPI001E3971BA|nr:hypothetical protein [Maritimibacter sp. 55A14]
MELTATALAQQLNLSKGRISQYVAEGKLDGCFEGSGRQRRFDLEKVADALGRKLDPGQMMGNGATTQKALQGLDGSEAAKPAGKKHPGGATRLADDDGDGYQLARTLKAQEEARRLRRQNAEAEGRFVLASEVSLQVQKMIGQEVAEFETLLREAARRLADDHALDFKTVRKTLIDMWRAHRAGRAGKLGAVAKTAEMTAKEKDADI